MERAARAVVRAARAAVREVRAVTHIHIPTAVERVERDRRERVERDLREVTHMDTTVVIR